MRPMRVAARAAVGKQTEINVEGRKEEVPNEGSEVVERAYTAYSAGDDVARCYQGISRVPFVSIVRIRPLITPQSH
jgi:hypothetical protein